MKENHLRLVRHMAVNIVLLLAAVMVLLLAAAHRTYTRQMERLDVYIGVLSGRTAQHAGRRLLLLQVRAAAEISVGAPRGTGKTAERGGTV